MKKLAICVLYLLFPILLLSQGVETIMLDAGYPGIKYSQPTILGTNYKITVEGTYRQWPSSQDNCFGVDAVWYNDLPFFNNQVMDDLVKELLKDPIWLGDSSNLIIPSIPTLFEGMRFGLRQYTGFRFNGEPLEKFPLDNSLHRYQFDIMGTGEPFKFQILDSVYSLQTEQTIPRYDDNSGFLKVTIEEQSDTIVNICGAELINNSNGTVQIIVDATIIVKDSSEVDKYKKDLYEAGQIGIIMGNRFICPDSIVCEDTRTYPIAVGLVVDNSASMEEPISLDDLFTKRIDAAKLAMNNFVDELQSNLIPMDSAFVMSFSNRPKIEQDWTESKEVLKESISKIKPDSATCFYSALIQALDKVKKHQNPGKAVIVLTDGDNTRGPVWSQECIELIRNNYSQIPIYLIALSFTNTPRELAALDTMNLIVNSTVKGNVFSINDKDSLKIIYKRISTTVGNDECCSIYFQGTPCKEPGEEKLIKLVFITGEKLIVKEIKVKCPLDTITSVKDIETAKNLSQIKIYPNPLENYTTIQFETIETGDVEISIFSIDGQLIIYYKKFFEPGLNTIILNTENYSTGNYQTIIKEKNKIQSKIFSIIR